MNTGAVLFGKLPAHGDFVSRGLNAAARGRIDEWLSTSLAAAREALGDRFADCYDLALPWQAAGPGIAGAIAPSQDATGRRFPMLLLAAGEDAGVACAALLYRAIGEGWTADRLASEAASPPDASVERWTGEDGRTLAGERPCQLLTAMLTELSA